MATASTERVRYVAMGEVQQTRLQVFSATGAQVYDSQFRLGNLVDWQLQDQQSSPLPDGTYLHLVTIKDFSGQLTQKYGTATLEQGQVYLEQSARTELPPAQSLALESSRLAETLSSIDRIGAAGLSRTIATAINGAGSVNNAESSNTVGTSGTTSSDIDVASTGTQNRIAKWLDNSGTLGDSIMFDNGNGVGVGTTDLTDVLVAGNDKFKIVDGSMTLSFRDFASGQGYLAIGSNVNGIKGFIGHTNTTDGFTLGSFSNHKLTIRTNSVNRLVVDTSGNVGIGTASPIYKLDVFGALRASRNVSSDVVVETSGGTNAWARLWMITPNQKWAWGTSRNFNGNQLYLFDDTFQQIRMAVQPGGGAITFPLGNVGIGTITPGTRLHVFGEYQSAIFGDSGLGSGVIGRTSTGGVASPGVYGISTASGGIGVRGNGTTGVYGVSTGGVGVTGEANASGSTGVYGTSTSGYAMYANGNAGQARGKGGFVKAMLVMEQLLADGGTINITRCYNGITNVSTGGCGFTITEPLGIAAGVYRIDFGFEVNDRFVSITPVYDSNAGSGNNVGANYRFFGSTAVEVFTFVAGDSDDTRAAEFTIVIF